MNWLWIAPMALVIGASVGALGAGGSIITVPALIYLLGLSPHAAATGSLIVVGASSLVGLVPRARAGQVRWRKGTVFGALGMGGAWAGSQLAVYVPEPMLLSLFAVLMFVVSGMMWARMRRDATSQPRPETTRVVPLIGTGLGVGVLTGFFGVGGGFAAVPGLVLALGLPMPAAAGTSLLVIIMNSATALAARAGIGLDVDWPLILGFAACAMVGTLLGGRLTARVPATTLGKVFAAMTALIGVVMAVNNVPHLVP